MSEIYEDVVEKIPKNDENLSPNFRNIRNSL